MSIHRHIPWQIATKVPKITLYFWIVKLLTTAMGESTSDYLVNAMSPYLAVGIGGLLLVAALIWQFRVKTYVAWTYWAAALAVSIAGTMGADVLHVGFGVPYVISTVFYLAVLILVFWWWYKIEGTLSIHSVTTKRREVFYWAAILATFALGTAAGDLTAYSLQLGFFVSGVVFAAVFFLPGLLYFFTRSQAVLTFWVSYIITRPFGASFADWFGKPVSIGGLGMGDGSVSLMLGILIILFVGYLSVSKIDVQSRQIRMEGRS